MNGKSPIILVHGAWSNAGTWDTVASLLRDDGHAVAAIDLPSHGMDPARPQNVGLSDYANRVAETLHKTGPALLVGHSMGGMAISAGAELAPDLVRKLVYVAAFLPRNGQSLVDLVKAGPDTGFRSAVQQNDTPGYTRLDPDLAAAFLFQDADDAQRLMALGALDTQPNQGQTQAAKLSGSNFGQIPRAYIFCEQDRTIPPSLQQKMVADTPCSETFSLNSGHVPQLTQPTGLTAILTKLGE